VGPGGAGDARAHRLAGRIVYLIKPLTYVNVTGPVLSQLARRLTFAAGDCVLVHDDMDLPPGALRVRMKGGDGGHRGVRSIQSAFGSDAFRRLKIGVGRPDQTGRAADHVLTTFTPTTMPVIERACTEAAHRILGPPGYTGTPGAHVRAGIGT
jgi:PTH1 family peptidyl-tRNA hydrolase